METRLPDITSNTLRCDTHYPLSDKAFCKDYARLFFQVGPTCSVSDRSKIYFRKTLLSMQSGRTYMPRKHKKSFHHCGCKIFQL